MAIDAPARFEDRARAPRRVGALALAAAWLYGLGFLGNLAVPKAIDSAAWRPLGAPLLVDLGLVGGCLLVFHPRLGSTRGWLRVLALAALYLLWQPLNGLVWHVTAPVGAIALHVLFALGAALLLAQALARRGPRHPLWLPGWLLALWATPTMSSGHLLLSLTVSLGLLLAPPRR